MTDNRRTDSRVACHLDATGPAGQKYEILDFTNRGMRIRGQSFSGRVGLEFELGGQRLRFLVTKIWERGDDREKEMGVFVGGDAPMLSRLGYLLRRWCISPPKEFAGCRLPSVRRPTPRRKARRG